MCSVRDVCKLLHNVEMVRIGWDGSLKDFDHKDEVQLDAYGDCGVSELEVNSAECVSIIIAVCPIKVNANN